MGPQISHSGHRRSAKYFMDKHAILDAIVAGGALPDRPGYFIAPTTVRGIEDGGRLADEESFGPLLPVVKDQG
ncbi:MULTISPECIES: aldehyde dehydrogenase family protein [unclassified Sphingobium]|uniref:aldehyde dehydrogenase family protein n=1 Tax=unclassified Sphingobium TaxID=2611147 RepID=UPI0039C9C238